jgi:hypothetical protein
MNKKTVFFIIFMMLIGILIPVTKSNVSYNLSNINSEPILEVSINPGFNMWTILFDVDNVGDATAHNVTFSGLSFTGKILYNTDSYLIIEELAPEPGSVFSSSNGFIGFGLFSVNITVTCDEGCVATDFKNGIVFGCFYFIP